MEILKNPWRHQGITPSEAMKYKQVSTNVQAVLDLLKHCPATQETPLIQIKEMATELAVSQVYLKDERARMGLGSFKATGAAYVIARKAAEIIAETPNISLENISKEQLKKTLKGFTFSCASAGNHGLSIAAGSRIFGAQAVIFLNQSVPESFAKRLREYGAKVVRAGNDYSESLDAAIQQIEQNGWHLISDTSWPGYTEVPTRLMEGYLAVTHETSSQMEKPPTHIFLQAGVGGIAAAATAWFRHCWGDAPIITIVEPTAAPAVIESIRAGKVVVTQGPTSDMGRLDCKEPSHVALNCLSRDADWFITLSDSQVLDTVSWLRTHSIETTSSGCAGLSVLHQYARDKKVRDQLGLDASSRALVILTEQS